MFLKLSKSEIKSMEVKQTVSLISRWESIKKAELYYCTIHGMYTAYKEEEKNLKSAFSTPVKVFIIKEMPTR